MLPNRNNIMKACQKIYRLLSETQKASFKQIQKQTGLNDINLCMGILYLLRKNIITQYTNEIEVCYSIQAKAHIILEKRLNLSLN